MKDPIAAFVEQGRQLLAEFASESLRLATNAEASPAAPQRKFIADFSVLIEGLLDSLHDDERAVAPQLATRLLECCTQMSRLAEALAMRLQGPDARAIERSMLLSQRLEKIIEPAYAQGVFHEARRGSWRQAQITLH